jgi:hypothetical protein
LSHIDSGRPARIQHRPLLCPRLSRWNPVWPERVGADDRALLHRIRSGDIVWLIFTSVHEKAHSLLPSSCVSTSIVNLSFSKKWYSGCKQKTEKNLFDVNDFEVYDEIHLLLTETR